MEEYFKNEKILKLDNEIAIQLDKITYFSFINKYYWEYTHDRKYLYEYQQYFKNFLIILNELKLTNILNIDSTNNIIIYQEKDVNIC